MSLHLPWLVVFAQFFGLSRSCFKLASGKKKTVEMRPGVSLSFDSELYGIG